MNRECQKSKGNARSLHEKFVDFEFPAGDHPEEVLKTRGIAPVEFGPGCGAKRQVEIGRKSCKKQKERRDDPADRSPFMNMQPERILMFAASF